MYDVELEPDSIRQIINYRKLFEILRLSVDLDIYALLEQRTTATELARSVELDVLFVRYFLNALCAIGLVEHERGEEPRAYQSTPIARQYLSPASALYLGRELFEDVEIRDLLQRYIRHEAPTEPITSDYWSPEIIKKLETIALLGGVQSAVKTIDLAGRTSLLDIGGGHGLYSIFFAKKHPDLKAWVLDLPQVIGVTRENIVKHGMAEQVTAIAGDYHTFEPHRAFDVIFVSNVTSSREELLSLLTRARTFLVSDGVVLLRSFAVDSASDIWSAVSALERYARRGKPGISREQLGLALRETGFTRTSEVYAAEGTVILSGTR